MLNTPEAANSITTLDVPPTAALDASLLTDRAGSNASDMQVAPENKLSAQDSGPAETVPPVSDEMGGSGSPQPKGPSQEVEEPSSPGVGVQLLDSTRQLGSRMFGMLRNRLPMGEPSTPTGHTHQPHPPQTPSSEQEAEPAALTSSKVWLNLCTQHTLQLEDLLARLIVLLRDNHMLEILAVNS